MANPTYKVQIDDDGEDKAFEALDQERLSKEIESKADIKATEKVEQMKQDLVKSLSGDDGGSYEWEKKGKKAPSDYDELFTEVDKRTIKPEQVDEIVEKKLEEKEKLEQKRQEEERSSQEKTIEERRMQFDQEWYDLVNEGKMPAVSKEVQEKIDNKVKLTQEEVESDPGLKARLNLVQIVQNSGKGAKLAYYEDYEKQPAGAKAPVFGGKPSAPKTGDDEWTYEDIKSEREELGW